MNTYFKKLSSFKFIILTLLWFLLTGVIAVILGEISPRYGSLFGAVMSYFLLYYGMKIFTLNPIDRTAIWKEPKEKVENRGLLAFIPFFVGGLVSAVFVLFIERFLPSFYEIYSNQPNILEGMTLSGNFIEILLIFISIVILAPIVEEFIFRGIFFNYLSKKRSTTYALVVSSLFFGALHVVTALPTAVIGFVLAFIYHKTGSLKLVIIGHMVNNFVAFMISLISLSLMENILIQGILGGVLLLFYVVGIIYFIRYMRQHKSYFKMDAPLYRMNKTMTERVLSPKRHRIIDISMDIVSGMRVYPGDPEVKITEVATVGKDGFSLRKIEMNTHAGTHVDFPSHYLPNHSLDSINLESFYGETQVLMTFEDQIDESATRVLARKGVLTKERAKTLVEEGVVLVGTSAESIEEKGDDQVHKLLLSHGIYILENLDLTEVMPGYYTLSAFPLKIKEAEASPVRAVLIDDVRRSF